MTVPTNPRPSISAVYGGAENLPPENKDTDNPRPERPPREIRLRGGIESKNDCDDRDDPEQKT
jgi:hypothetical protein